MILKSLATAASFASRHELTLLLLLSPLMLFSSRLSLIPLVLIPALWFSRWLATGRVTRRTGLEWPILALLLLVPVSLWVSVDPQTSLPRLSVLILGLAIFYAIANSANAGKRLSALTAMMLSLGFLVAVAGVTGMEGVKKAPVVGTLQVRMAESRGVSELLGRSFNANEVGGTLAMLIPFALAILVFPASKKLKTLAGISLAFMLLAAVFSQSRWSFVALAAASLAVLALRNRWCWLALPAMGLASVFLVWAVGPGKVLASFGSVASTDSVVGRLEIWERALYLIQDFPLTGVGLNTFVPATQRLYPYFTIPDVNLGHAHNLLLQLGADFGIPGIAVVATFFACLLFLWKAGLRFARGSQLEGAYVGFLGMLIAYLVFGLIDAIAFGAKPSILVWLAAGGVVLARKAVGAEEKSREVGSEEGKRFSRIAPGRSRWIALMGSAMVLILAAGTTPFLVETYYRNIGNVQIARGSMRGDDGALASGEALLDEAIRLDSRDGLAFRSLGRLRLARQQFPEAIAALETAISLGAKEPLAYFYLGSAYQNAGRTDQATLAWRRAGALGYFVRLGRERDFAKDYGEAEKYFGVALAIDAKSSEAWYGLGYAHLQKGQTTEAEDDLSKALEFDPKNVDAYLAMGDSRRDRRDYTQAEQWYSQAMKIRPDNPSAFLKRGLNFFAMGQLDSAISQFREALARDPAFAENYLAHLYLAKSYLQLGRLPDAVAEYEKTVALRPEPGFLLELGRAYVRVGLYRQARREIEATLALTPGNAEVQRELEKIDALLKN